MKKLVYFKYLFIGLAIFSCKQEEPDLYGIDRSESEKVNALVVNTLAGWTLLTEPYGFLDLLEPMNDSLKIDGLKVKALIYKGRTYFDDNDASRHKNKYFRDFTFASLIHIETMPDVFNGPNSPYIKVVWSPNYSDDVFKYPDGYGYIVQAKEDGFTIGQYSFPGTTGLGTFKTKVEAYKMGMYVLHLMTISNDLPGTDKSELNFLKIDWYE